MASHPRWYYKTAGSILCLNGTKYCNCNFVTEGLTPPLNYYRAALLNRLSRPPQKKLEIETPGLLIFGELDAYLLLDHVTVAQKYVTNLEGRIVKGANHFVQQDDPDTVNRYMREFLEKN